MNHPQHVALLGRQPAIGMLELERQFGSNRVMWISEHAARIKHVDPARLAIEKFGGVLKFGQVIAEVPGERARHYRGLSTLLVRLLEKEFRGGSAKITLGLSAYGFDNTLTTRDLQQTGLILKKKVRASGGSLRLIPNQALVLSTATSHHNQLGRSDYKIEVFLIRDRAGNVTIARSIGVQNISAYAARDQTRPKRDARVGMLPPKLAQIMLNCALPDDPTNAPVKTVLDPFCGTGVVLQEALLRGYYGYGTDLEPRMIEFSDTNLRWLQDAYVRTDMRLPPFHLEVSNAMTHRWSAEQSLSPISAVVSEVYLGAPLSTIPSPAKLIDVSKNCDHIIEEFLKNISFQIDRGTVLCLAVPAWRQQLGADSFTRLTLSKNPSLLTELGYDRISLKRVNDSDLIYARDDTIVGREILLLRRRA